MARISKDQVVMARRFFGSAGALQLNLRTIFEDLDLPLDEVPCGSLYVLIMAKVFSEIASAEEEEAFLIMSEALRIAVCTYAEEPRSVGIVELGGFTESGLEKIRGLWSQTVDSHSENLSSAFDGVDFKYTQGVVSEGSGHEHMFWKTFSILSDISEFGISILSDISEFGKSSSDSDLHTKNMVKMGIALAELLGEGSADIAQELQQALQLVNK